MKSTIITNIVVITTISLALFVSLLWSGCVLSMLWLWFIVSTFGAAPLGIAQSIGLAIIASFLTQQVFRYEDKNKSLNKRLAQYAMNAFVFPAMTLFMGWIVKGFI